MAHAEPPGAVAARIAQERGTIRVGPATVGQVRRTGQAATAHARAGANAAEAEGEDAGIALRLAVGVGATGYEARRQAGAAGRHAFSPRIEQAGQAGGAASTAYPLIWVKAAGRWR